MNNMNSKLFLSIVLFIIAGLAQADVVFWFYDLTELPENWINNHFTFSDTGAYILVEDYWNPKSYSKSPPSSGFILSEYVIIPPDIDSLVVDVQQFVDLYASGPAGAQVILNVEINGCLTLELWKRAVGYFRYKSSTLTDSLPIHAVITNLNPGDLVQFEFITEASACYQGSALGEWWLWDAQLTGYGSLSLIPRTWAEIKSAF